MGEIKKHKNVNTSTDSMYLHRVFSAVVGAASRVVPGVGCECVTVPGLSVQGRQDVDITLKS